MRYIFVNYPLFQPVVVRRKLDTHSVSAISLKNTLVGSFHRVCFKLGCYLPLQYVQDEQQTASLSRQQILDVAMPPLGSPLWPKRMQWRAGQYSSRDTSSALIPTSSSLTWKYRNQAILKRASMIILKQQISLLNNSRIINDLIFQKYICLCFC